MLELLSRPSIAVSLRFVAGLTAGVLATLAMDQVLPRLEEGETAPQIAAGVLTGTVPDDAPRRLASVVHYTAGGLTGPLYVWFLFTFEGLLGSSLPVALGTGVVVFVLMVGFFAVVVLPRSLVSTHRVAGIRRDWAISAAVYLIVMVPVVTVASTAL